jgi:hypothetical protein
VTCFSLDELSRMAGERVALHRTGGLCACGCGGRADRVRVVFSSDRWPELVGNPDNFVALSDVHQGGHLPRRAFRHAEHLAATLEMRDHLAAQTMDPIRSAA